MDTQNWLDAVQSALLVFLLWRNSVLSVRVRDLENRLD